MESREMVVNVWMPLLIVVLTLGLLLPLWVMVRFALVSDKTRDEIHGDE